MKYIKAFFLGFCIWVVSFILFSFIHFAVSSLIYPWLLDAFPKIIPQYNFVNEREDYERFYRLLALISAIINAFVTSHISLRLDNGRMEFMITKTEGLYTIKEGAKLYYSTYFTADVFAGVMIPLPFILVIELLIPKLSFLPDGVLSLIAMPLAPTMAFVDALGGLFGYLVMVLVIFVSRILSGLRCVDLWRGIWLSDIEYVG